MILIAMSTVAIAANNSTTDPYTLQYRVSSPDGRRVQFDFDHRRLTGLGAAVARPAAGTLITFQCQNMPWDQALYESAAKHGLVITLKGKTIRAAKN